MQTQFHKKTACFLILLMLNQILFPPMAFALTSGPTQPELQSFQPAGTTEMVDLFSGDFNYNIPLFELPGPDGGYPVNLFYNSVTSPEQEASFVGLGWNIGIGAITRQMRGLPDDFNGEKIERELDMKPDWTVGVRNQFGLEFLGLNVGNFGLTSSLGLSLMYNSYKGIGFSIDPSVNANMGFKQTNITSGFNLSMNTFDGANANASFGIDSETKKDNKWGLGLGLSIREGGFSDISLKYKGAGQSIINNYIAFGLGNLTYERTPYTPQVSMPYAGTNISLKFNSSYIPLNWTHPYNGLSGFFSGRWLSQNKISSKAYGAMYIQNADKKSLSDFNREKDGVIRNGQKNLAIPSFTTDALSVNGHGVAGTYQLYRSDIPFFYDQETKEESAGGSLAVELGAGIGFSFAPPGLAGFSRVGVDVDVNYSINKSYRPSLNLGQIKAHPKIGNNKFQPYFYKVVGEMIAENKSESDYMGGDKLVSLKIDGLEFGDDLIKHHDDGYGYYTLNKTIKGKPNRKPQSNSIQPITNYELTSTSNTEILPEYRIKFYNKNQPNAITSYSANDLTFVNRPLNTQIAGYTTVNPNGSRWVFALPVMNHKQVEHTFSVDRPNNNCYKVVDITRTNGNTEVNHHIPGTDEYSDKTTTPAYAHSYLLTSVLGTDYIDVDPNDGEPNDKDLGYWVKIEYIRTSNAYKWRTPFAGATYIGGLANKDSDDKAMYTYGEREQFYPAKMVTKSHIAEFHYSKRNDAYGAQTQLQNFGDADIHGDVSYKLDEIKIFSKKELELAIAENRAPIPMKTVHFGYNNGGQEYKLCQNVHNNINFNPNTVAPNSGKLTLERVYFTYENNTRGAFSPYKFQYNGSNAPYSDFAMDRWGVYKPNTTSDPCFNIYNPFVDQNLPESVHDERISTWHLTDIFLPSGAKIKLDLGRDHYSYEQDKVAGQMFQIVGFGGTGQANHLYTNDLAGASPEARDIYFQLEGDGIPTSWTSAQQQQAIDKYFNDLHGADNDKQLFFQINTDLLKRNNPLLCQDITGYANIESYGIDQNSNTAGHYKRGRIRLKPFPVQVKGKYYHPFALSAWQFIKLSLPDMMYGYQGGTVPASDHEKGVAVRNLLAAFTSVAGVFQNYYNTCSNREYAKVCNLSKSFIRLNTPDKKMYGDGVRVKKVLLYDNWGKEETPVYGTVYDYDEETAEIGADGKKIKISSGTASNTPGIGSQESSLRYAKHFVEDFKLRQDEQHTIEYPLNESYYPGASIGYRKVTVKSLATEYSVKRLNNEAVPGELPSDLPDGFATSGVSVNEFYTYKDFPIITRETNIRQNTNPIKVIPLFGFGTITNNFYVASQGYSIEINNMHGRPHKVANYPQDKDGNILFDAPISFVRYDYQQRTEAYTEAGKTRNRRVLINDVQVINSDQDPNDNTKAHILTNMEMGVDRELFVDARAKLVESASLGIGFNYETSIVLSLPFLIPVPGIPAFSAIPTGISNNLEIVRLSSTNKVIRRSGIPIKTVAYDGQSRVETQNLAFDKYTGQPLLTSVNNSYTDNDGTPNLIYNYNIPGHFMYERMGAAYENWGINFTGTVVSDGCGYYNLNLALASIASDLQEGDEYIVTNLTTLNSPNILFKTKATLISKKSNSSSGYELKLAFDNAPNPQNNLDFLVIRSGKRNQLTASVGNITALSNPTLNRAAQTCEVNLGQPATSTTQTQCIPHPCAKKLTDFLDTLTQNYPAVLACAANNGNKYSLSLGNPCVPAVSWALNSFLVCVECNQANSFTPSYISKIKLLNAVTSFGDLLSIQNGYDAATPNNIMTDAALDAILNTALTNGNIMRHEIKGCTNNPNIIQMSVFVRQNNGFIKEYVLNINNIFCLGTNIASPQTQTVYQGGTNATATVNYKTINDVLSITAATFKDNWDLPNNQCTYTAAMQGLNTFQKGLRGIFRQHETWTYVADRNQSSPVNLKVDGDMDNVPMFSWFAPYAMLCLDKWKKTTTTTQYSGLNGEGVESKNIINQYSSVLYGYNGLLPVAIGSNATMQEIAYEGFEEHQAQSTSALTSPETGNITFIYNPACTSGVAKTYDVLNRFNPFTSSSSIRIPLNVPYSGFNTQLPTKAVLSVHNGNNTPYVAEVPVSSITSFSTGSNSYPILSIPINATVTNCLFFTNSAITAENWFSGTVTLYYNTAGSGSPNLAVSNAQAHTGNKSLSIPAGNADFVVQKKLQLTKGKQYVVSAWVYTGDKTKHSYENDFELIIDNFANTFKPTGPIIEGWQRVEGIFTDLIASPILVLRNKTSLPIYVDDIRIFPKNANIQSYIYDPVTYRVTEILDNNNYFARYKYDRQGSPISVQKETEKGIKTIQETGSHTKRTN